MERRLWPPQAEALQERGFLALNLSAPHSTRDDGDDGDAARTQLVSKLEDTMQFGQ